jgi:hypothetical protein
MLSDQTEWHIESIGGGFTGTREDAARWLEEWRSEYGDTYTIHLRRRTVSPWEEAGLAALDEQQVDRLTLAETPGRRMKVLVGDSVFEQADVTISDGHLLVAFEADDLDSIDVDLLQLQGKER